MFLSIYMYVLLIIHVFVISSLFDYSHVCNSFTFELYYIRLGDLDLYLSPLITQLIRILVHGYVCPILALQVGFCCFIKCCLNHKLENLNQGNELIDSNHEYCVIRIIQFKKVVIWVRDLIRNTS